MKNEDLENKIVSYVDYDKSLDLENNTKLKSFFNLFFIPILNSLPKDFKKIIRKTNNSAAVVIDNATSHKALEVLYSRGELFSMKKIGGKFFKYVWFNVNNSKAVRNRLKFVKRELKKHLTSISEFDRDIEIISIASGSSRAIVEVVKDGHYLDGTKLSITFLDKSEHAIQYSKEMSLHISHLPIKLNWVQDSAGAFLRNASSKKFDVVEIVGLLDYFNDEKVLEIFTGIYNILQPGGVLITSNINHNSEEKFITKVIDWPMIYRTAEELGGLVKKSGFEYNNIKAFYEPLRVHALVVAKK